MQQGEVTASTMVFKEDAEKVKRLVKDPEILEALGLVEYEGFHRSGQNRGTKTAVIRSPHLVEPGDPLWEVTALGNVHVHEYR